jgi:nucleoside-diphosphate-sugar epimerase
MTALLVLGCGYAGTAVARLARERGLSVLATVRTEARAAELRGDGFDVLVSPDLDTLASRVDSITQVVVAFPPDGTTDAAAARRLGHAGALTYISSTAVYGDARGLIDDTTPVATHLPERAARRVAAEDAWRSAGAAVLRCPGIYGPDRGLHLRVVRGEHRIPGDGSGATSRIHVEDLAQLVLASLGARRETFVVGDLSPAPQREVVGWIAQEYGVPMPPSVPVEAVHETLRGDRRVDGRRALDVLGVTLLYPHYRDGMVRR